MLAAAERMPVCAIGIMAKAPAARRSKTRLCPPLRPEQAAALSGGFLRDTVDNIQLAARSAPIEVCVAYAPIGSEDAMSTVVGAETKLLLADGNAPTQEGVDGLGRCLLQAIEGMLAEGYASACVLSSDCPTLPTNLLCKAAQLLLAPGERAVLGAAHDGGYYLLGVKAPHVHLFRNIAWSTSNVAAQTRVRAREMDLTLVELDAWYDVDDARSLATLLNDRQGYAAPRTREVIERLGLRDLLQTREAAE